MDQIAIYCKKTAFIYSLPNEICTSWQSQAMYISYVQSLGTLSAAEKV